MTEPKQEWENNDMLKQLRIQNFKGWKDTGNILMAPISLFFGANSSGKSSIGQFMMMLKQTVESSDRKAVFNPGGKNSAVQLGSYQEMVFHRDPKNKIKFEYQWLLQNIIKIKDPVSAKSYSGNEMAFQAEVGFGDGDQYSSVVENFKYRLIYNDKQTLSVELSQKQGSKEYQVIAEEYNFVRKKMRAWALKDIVRFYGFPDEAVAYYQNAEFVQLLNFEQEQLFKSICYLGPLRSKADRIYT